jgi:glycosyltransferase involved in cell wall biosynthesis
MPVSTPPPTKPKLLAILHLPPPHHGAAKVGEFIRHSHLINGEFTCYYIPIRSSDTIADIGKVSFKKLYLVAELYFKVMWALVVFRPNLIYVTVSIRSIAFYRDLLLSTLWKSYQFFTHASVYYHYHTKGVNEFVRASDRNRRLTRFFLHNTHLILLSPLLKNDFSLVQTYTALHILPNGIDDPLKNDDFMTHIAQKYAHPTPLHFLYLAHMMHDKGYKEVLELALVTKERPIQYHFAGSWQSGEDKAYFTTFVQKHGLESTVTYHGFVHAEAKRALLLQAHLLLYPSKNDAFPLTLLESLAYGIPIIATQEGSIPYILDARCGILLEENQPLVEVVEEALTTLIHADTAQYCQQRYHDHFHQNRFEANLSTLLHKGHP